MTAGRLYCIQSWNNASETSGEQIGNRLAQSRGLHFNRDGSANVALYAEDQDNKRKTSIPLSDRILPQKKRLSTLRDQLIELETEYKTTDMSIEEYSTLRDILMVKINRAEVLYKKAVSVRPTQPQESIGEDELPIESTYEINDIHSANSVCGVGIIDDLSDENCLKLFLQKACTTVKTLVKWCQQAKAYYQTLKEV
jgi:hypothetical protein